MSMVRNVGQHAQGSPAAAERAELCELMLEVGEHAPTLCGDWDAGDLAAHLVVRENRPDAVLGLVVAPLRGYTGRLEKSARERQPFTTLVERLRSGPPPFMPLGLPVVKDRANLHEYFIHHEDVRRAQPGWKVRELPAATSAALWNVLRLMAPMLMRGIKDTRVTLRTPDGGERSVGRADSTHQVTLTGPAGELLIYLSGRRQVAEVKVSGDTAGQARLAAASLGM